jgi:hypothetical protein
MLLLELITQILIHIRVNNILTNCMGQSHVWEADSQLAGK